MALWDRLSCRCSGVEVHSAPEELHGYVDWAVQIVFTPREDFHNLVKRWAKSQDDEQIKLTVAALENEMGARLK